MITKLKKLFILARQMILRVLILLKCPLKAKAVINGKSIYFHNASDSFIAEKILLHGVQGYEFELGKFLQLYPYDFKTFVDGGANIGFYSVLMRCAYGPDINIAAIEAFPNNVRYMETLQKNNAIKFDILPFALADQSGQRREFYVPTSHRSSKLPPAASLVNNFKGSGGVFDQDSYDVIEVETIGLHDVIKNNPPPYLIKMDIEGYELPVLKAVEGLLTERDDIDLVVEIMINDKDKTEIFDLLIACGYDAYLITNAGLVRENRPLTLPYHSQWQGKLRTCWKNHFFTKRPDSQMRDLSIEHFNYFI